jgi:hypothetical protein
MRGLISLSTRLVVMAERGRQMLHDLYQVPLAKIDLVPHGIPDVGFVDPTYFKDQFGVEGKVVLLTFGLLSPNKESNTFWMLCRRFWRNSPKSSTSSSAPPIPTRFGSMVKPTGSAWRF